MSDNELTRDERADLDLSVGASLGKVPQITRPADQPPATLPDAPDPAMPTSDVAPPARSLADLQAEESQPEALLARVREEAARSFDGISADELRDVVDQAFADVMGSDVDVTTFVPLLAMRRVEELLRERGPLSTVRVETGDHPNETNERRERISDEKY